MTPSLVISQGVRTRHSSCQKDLFLYTVSRIIKFLWRNGLQQLHPVTLEVSKKFFSNLDDVIIQFNSLQLFLIWRTLVLFKGPMIPLFWTDGDICPGFQSQGGSLTFMLHHLHHLHSSDSPLVRHMLTSWQLVCQPSDLIHSILVNMCSGIGGTRTQDHTVADPTWAAGAMPPLPTAL